MGEFDIFFYEKGQFHPFLQSIVCTLLNQKRDRKTQKYKNFSNHKRNITKLQGKLIMKRKNYLENAVSEKSNVGKKPAFEKKVDANSKYK